MNDNPTTSELTNPILEIARDIAYERFCDDPPCADDCECWREAKRIVNEESE